MRARGTDVSHATEHRIDLKEGAQPVRALLYQQGPARRAIVKTDVEKKLYTGVPKRATKE